MTFHLVCLSSNNKPGMSIERKPQVQVTKPRLPGKHHKPLKGGDLTSDLWPLLIWRWNINKNLLSSYFFFWIHGSFFTLVKLLIIMIIEQV